MYNNTVRPRRSFVRLLHAAVQAPAVDVYVNNRPVARGLKYKAYTDYLQLPPGNYNVEVFPANEKQTPVIQERLSVEPQTIYTVAAVNDLQALKLFPVIDFEGLDLSEFYTFPYGMGQSPQKPSQGMGPIGPYGPVGPGFDSMIPVRDEKDYILPYKEDKMNSHQNHDTSKSKKPHIPMEHEMKSPYGMMPQYEGMCPTCGMESGYDMGKPYPQMKTFDHDMMEDYKDMNPSYKKAMPYPMPKHDMMPGYGMCPMCNMDYGHGPMNPYLHQQPMMMPDHKPDMMNDLNNMHHPMMPQFGFENESHNMNPHHMMGDTGEPMMKQPTCEGPYCGMNPNPQPKPWPHTKAPLCPRPEWGYPQLNAAEQPEGMMGQDRMFRGGRR